ncbi:MAG: HD domain-containing protein [Patescibacteria group bacterium]|nr:HD domain-containing protein [Patescibacteria group bacterium]
MKYEDKVYGDVEINDLVILDLINCGALQRLKNIDQSGYFEPHFPGIKYSRFEHSMGVYLLLKIYNTSIEEQIAGLIHDVSHSAFSHCIDYVLNFGSQKNHDHQDNIFEDFVRKSEIPEILKKYNFNLEYILNDKNFPLKERELPDLCADRIDYSLRTAISTKEIPNAKYFFNNLIVENNNWFFKNFESAEKYAELFLKINTTYYSGLPSALMFQTVGDYLKYALKNNYINENDLYTTDEEVLEKIKPFLEKDGKLKLLFDRMNNKTDIKNDKNDYDVSVFCKSRVVDPLCFYNGEIKRVSDVGSEWREIIKEESKPKEYFLKFEK